MARFRRKAPALITIPVSPLHLLHRGFSPSPCTLPALIIRNGAGELAPRGDAYKSHRVLNIFP